MRKKLNVMKWLGMEWHEIDSNQMEFFKLQQQELFFFIKQQKKIICRVCGV